MTIPLPRTDLEHIARSTEPLWNEMRGGNLFLTGGTGFFGAWLLESWALVNDFLQLDMRITLLTRNGAAFKKKSPHLASRRDIQFCEGDVRTFSFPNGEFSHIIHAATTSSEPVPHLEMFATIVDGTRRVLDFATTHCTKKMLFVSSGAVYGQQPEGVSHITEDGGFATDCLNPSSVYGTGKRSAELLCSVYADKYSFDATVARCFAFFGPGLKLDGHFAIGNFISDVLREQPIRIGSDGRVYRSYLYAADLAIWLWTLLFLGRTQTAYNVGSETSLELADVAAIVQEAGHSSVGVKLNGSRTKFTSRYVPSTARARSELKLEPTINLHDGLARSFDWERTRLGV